MAERSDEFKPKQATLQTIKNKKEQKEDDD